jgi:hypothetical protein
METTHQILKSQADAGSPSAEAVENLIRKVEEHKKHLHAERKLPADRVARLKLIDHQLSELEHELKFKNDTLDRDEWAMKDREKRQDIIAELDGFLTELTDLNLNELREGKGWFVGFVILFAIVVSCYLYLHTDSQRQEVNRADINKAANELSTIDLEIKELRSTKAKAQARNGTLEAKDLDSAKHAVENFRATAVKLEFSTSALELLGKVEAEVTKGEITETNTFADMSKTVSAELESFRSSFLRVGPAWRWIEIAFWAELGTLVGILFYIAGTLSDGYFLVAEITMFWTEIVISPIVVVAIFFLFNLTGITGISVQGTSITGIVGFAFIFGFAIRRTLGLFDNVKKRIFPEPEPASSSPERSPR